MVTKEEIKEGVSEWVCWWIKQRKRKLQKELTKSMSMNPFLLPFLYNYHKSESLEDLADLIIQAHLMVGHNTGFGKLIDEKILPNVFHTAKLDKRFREQPPYINDYFTEIDHIVTRPDGRKELLSLKAGKWTIQLTMAKELNNSFDKLIKAHPGEYAGIVVGVFYGNAAGLTDKYEILRGINRGANHNVVDLTEHVTVVAGDKFWDWLSGTTGAQDAVMAGIQDAIQKEQAGKTTQVLLAKFKAAFIKTYLPQGVTADSPINWYDILHQVNNDAVVKDIVVEDVIVETAMPQTVLFETDTPEA